MWLKSAAANAGDKATYTDNDLDQAIIAVGDDLSQRGGQLTGQVAEIALTKGSAALPMIDADFRAECLNGEAYLCVHTAGTITTGLTAKAATVVAIGAVSVVATTAATTGACALLAGDSILFAGDATVYQLQADATQAGPSSYVTLSIDPPLAQALAGGEAITVRDPRPSNLTLDGTGPIVQEGQRLLKLKVWDPAYLSERQARQPDLRGQPEALCWDTAVSGRVFPIPDDFYGAKVPWLAPFTEWQPGVPLFAIGLNAGAVTLSLATAGGGSGWGSAPTISFSGGGGTGAAATVTVAGGRVATMTLSNAGSGYTSAPIVYAAGYDARDRVLNISGDYFRQALSFGGTAILQFSDLKRRFGSASWQRYEAYVARLAGITQAPQQRRLTRRR